MNKQYLINIPKILKIIFKKYEWSGGKGSKIDRNVNLPIILKKDVLQQYYLRKKSLNLPREYADILDEISNCNHDYYLFAFS